MAASLRRSICPKVTGRRPAVIVARAGLMEVMASANLFGGPLAASGFVDVVSGATSRWTVCRATSRRSRSSTSRRATDLAARVHPAVDGERLAVFGSVARWRGGAARRLRAFPAIKAVVASVPSHVVWQGTHPGPSMKTSSWSARRRWSCPYVLAAPRHASGRNVAGVVRGQPESGVRVGGGSDSGRTHRTARCCSSLAPKTVSGRVVRWSTWRWNVCAGIASVSTASTRDTRVADTRSLIPPYRVGPVENPWPSESYRQPQWMRSDLPGLAMGGHG